MIHFLVLVFSIIWCVLAVWAFWMMLPWKHHHRRNRPKGDK